MSHINKTFRLKRSTKLHFTSKSLRTGASRSLSAVWIVLTVFSMPKGGTAVTDVGKSAFRKPARVRQTHAKTRPASQWARPRRRIGPQQQQQQQQPFLGCGILRHTGRSLGQQTRAPYLQPRKAEQACLLCCR